MANLINALRDGKLEEKPSFEHFSNQIKLSKHYSARFYSQIEFKQIPDMAEYQFLRRTVLLFHILAGHDARVTPCKIYRPQDLLYRLRNLQEIRPGSINHYSIGRLAKCVELAAEIWGRQRAIRPDAADIFDRNLLQKAYHLYKSDIVRNSLPVAIPLPLEAVFVFFSQDMDEGRARLLIELRPKLPKKARYRISLMLQNSGFGHLLAASPPSPGPPIAEIGQIGI